MLPVRKPPPLRKYPVQPPLKHKRYPLVWRPRDKLMTIAAGFVHQGGILLCSDTEIQTPGLKSLGMKLGWFYGDWGIIAGAIAGNADYATGALNKLERDLKHKDPNVELIDAIDESLNAFYSLHVLSHPHYQYIDIGYSLLLAIRPPNELPRLYVTNETVVRPVSSAYRCEGIGRDVGHSVLQSLYYDEMPERRARLLAAYMLARVKQNVPGCDGPSVFLNLGLDGEVTTLQGDPELVHVENVSSWFDQSASEFLLNHTCSSEDEFKRQLETLIAQALHARALWTELSGGANKAITSSNSQT